MVTNIAPIFDPGLNSPEFFPNVHAFETVVTKLVVGRLPWRWLLSGLGSYTFLSSLFQQYKAQQKGAGWLWGTFSVGWLWGLALHRFLLKRHPLLLLDVVICELFAICHDTRSAPCLPTSCCLSFRTPSGCSSACILVLLGQSLWQHARPEPVSVRTQDHGREPLDKIKGTVVF